MLRYGIRRLLQSVPTVLIVSIVVFLMMHLAPGDPVRMMSDRTATPEDIENLRRHLGLDEPLHVQYSKWLGRVLQGDLGTSLRSRVPISDEISRRLPRTLALTVASLSYSVFFGVVAGVVCSVRSGSPLDTSVMVLAVLGMSVPAFWLGLMLILVFSVMLNWLPSGGVGTWRHLVLPAFSLGVSGMGLIARMTRSTMLDVLAQDYIRTARAKGLAERTVLYRHALRNAMIPTVTIVGLQFGMLMAGAVITESVFSWPGMGWLLVRSIQDRDFPVVQGAVLVASIGIVLTNVVVDMLYGMLNPKIRYE